MKKIFTQLAVLAGLGIMLSACHKAEMVNISQPLVSTANGITSDTLKGTVKGTMLAGKTYYFKSDITVNDGDTLMMQSGVHLVAIGDGLTPATSPEIFMHGTFISLGTQAAPNYITVQNAADLHTQATAQNYTNALKGWWGGITCTPATATVTHPSPTGGDAIIKWTHIEFGGGPAGTSDDQSFYTTGSPRYNMYFANITKNLIIEDSWFFGSKDDNIRVSGGKISVMRNTFELCGGVGGEFFNMKSGTVGDLAYNMCIGAATNSLKASDAGTTGTQCNVNMYNNTMVNGGYRQTKTGRGGSIDYEKSAKGSIYNNLIVNCRFGTRITSDADVANIKYNNQYLYGYSPAIVTQFYSTDGVGVKQANDILSTTPQANNPMFYGYDVNQYNFTANPGPISATLQPYAVIAIGTGNFKLQASSPGLGKGKTDFSPLASVKTTGTYGTTITLPGKDIGAYQNDGTGNQH
ncbi:hypothetical protein [Mucilaginibacter polytrichastri]|uniref:Right handed beta helix domain-containing protein n=1 Tax=Mucilaginibacter polytrichastri TaxID=1302689 RepID=A0A1Q5ZZF0_9SPHI|nr:hypothetical protein [Mucilaginibacter polytrichastri]OKS87127.1 hypothetical protein RG47T_2586 [Mucilaginibacter polytrichastri]SFS87835.1 hypothetical protein SAMN04487890_105196 [Mucilaginibacter polytrichastri]